MSYIFSIEKKRHLKQLVVHLRRVYILIFIKNMLIYLFILYIVLNPQSENDQNILLVCKIWTVACVHLFSICDTTFEKGADGFSSQVCWGSLV